MREREEGALSSYLSAIRAHPWVVGLATLAAVLGSLLLLATRDAEYEATADLLVDPLPLVDETFRGLSLIRDTGDPVRTVQTAASLVESPAIAEDAAEKLGQGWTAQSVLGAVEVNPVGESNILGVTATAASGEEAARVANQFVDSTLVVREQEIAEQVQAEIEALEARIEAVRGNETAEAELLARRDQLQSVAASGDPTLGKSQEAVPPTSAVGASPALIVVMATLAGLVIGSAAALLMELFSRRLRDEDDATAIYPLPVLIRVPELAGRKRRGPVGANWFMPPEIREPFRTLSVQLDQPDGPHVLMVTSASAGDGKTTTAVNLAVSLAAAGNSVVLLDFDLRKPDVGWSLGLPDGTRLAELLAPSVSIEELLQSPSHLGELRVLAPTAEADDAEWIEAVSFRLPEVLAQASELADFVVVDTAPLGEVGDALRLVADVEDILLVVRPGNTSEGQLEFLRDLLERTGKSPAGMIVLSRTERPSRGYYSYGYAQQRRSDQLRRPEAAPSPVRARTDRAASADVEA